MDKVYTRQGDNGDTYSLMTQKRISKGSKEFEFYGKLDKALAFIGLLYGNVRNTNFKRDLNKIIAELHNIYTNFTHSSRFDASITYYLEKRIDEISVHLSESNDFLMETFTSKKAALANVCRVMIREVEREAVRQGVSKEVLAFLNRLSDYFFILVRLWEVDQKTYKDLLTNKDYSQVKR